MGVKDLWQLLAPIGRRVSVETLEGKTLAIDASIWITQFIKAMRDEEGKMLKNAHLLGTLRRVLKLMFHRIKPLFVFDGATPTLKLRVVQARRKNQDKQEENKRVAALRLLRAQLKQHASEQAKISANSSNVDDDNSKFVSSFMLSKGQAAQTIHTTRDGGTQSTVTVGDGATPVRVSINNDEEEVEWVDGYESLRSKPLDGGAQGSPSSQGGLKDDGEQEWQLPENTGDLSPDVLAALPAHIRKSLIEEARRRQRMESRAHYLPVAGNPALYSQTQLSNFLSSSKLNRKFADAQVTIEGSAGLGSKIAAEGSKMYKFTSRITSASAGSIAGNDRAHHGISGKGAGGAVGLGNDGAILTSATMDAGSDDDMGDADMEAGMEDDEYWEPAEMLAQAVGTDGTDCGDWGFCDDDGDSDIGNSDGALGIGALSENSFGTVDKLVGEIEEVATMANELGSFLIGGFKMQEQGQDYGTANSVCNVQVLGDASQRQAEVFQLYDSDSDNASNSGGQAEGDEEVAWESESAASAGEDQGQGLVSGNHGRGDTLEVCPCADVGADVGAGSLSSPIAPAWRLFSQGSEGANVNNTFANSSGCSGYVDDSDALDQTASDRPVLDRAVLDRAVLTASSMADWAGRAVRNALRDLHNSGSTSKVNVGSAGSSALDLSAAACSRELQPSSSNSNRSDDVLIKPDLGPATSASVNVLTEESSPVPHAPGFENETEEERVTSVQEAHRDADGDTRDARRRFNNAMRDTETLTDEMREEVILLLQALNLPYIIAPYEAEAQCAVLEQLGLVDGVVTEDSDALLFGAKTVYKNIFSDKKFVEVYLAEDARLEMGLHREDLVALAYFLGSDYAEGVTGVGIVNAVEIVHAFPMHSRHSGNGQKPASSSCSSSSSAAVQQAATCGADEAPLEGLRKFKDWLHGFDLQSELLFNSPAAKLSGGSSVEHAGIDANLVQFSQKHRSGRSRWSVPDNFPDPLVARAYLHPQAHYSTDPFSWTVPLRGPVRRFCSDRLGWTNAQMDLAIDPVLKRFAERNTQTRIDAHYLTYHGDTRFAKIASDRLREAVVQITGKRSSTLALGVGGVGDAGEGSTNSSKRRRTKKKTARAVDAVECI